MAVRATPEKKEEKARTRAVLLRAALQLGAAHGFSSVGLREVAREAGIAPTSFYRHFADMEELGLALAEELVVPLLQGVRAHTERPRTSVGEAVLGVIDHVLENAAADPELTRFLLAELAGCSPRLRAALRGAVSDFADGLRALFDREAADAAPPRELTQAAAALLLDGCLRELELGAGGRARVRAALELSLNRLLTPGRSRSAT